MSHIPVLLSEMLTTLAPKAGGLYVDATFGAGGYSRAILEAADCRVVALDQDPHAVARAAELKAAFGARFDFAPGRFSEIASLTASFPQADGIVFDIGVSSMQIDEAERGFSFKRDGELDMRMSGSGESAADVVNHASEETLADIVYHLGEERAARRVARAITLARKEAPFTRTAQLAEVVRKAVTSWHGKPAGKIDPATKTFQALRIYVNQELDELRLGLAGALERLHTGGRLVVVTFHGLEDQIVKAFFAQHSGRGTGSRHLPPQQVAPARLRALTTRAIAPTEEEISANPRARSAKLHAAITLAQAGGAHA